MRKTRAKRPNVLQAGDGYNEGRALKREEGNAL